MISILKKSFQIYAKNFLKIAVLVLMISVPVAIVQTFVLEPSIDLNHIIDVLNQANTEGGEQLEVASRAANDKFLRYLGFTSLLSMLGLISQTSVVKLTLSAYREGNDLCNISDSFETGFKLFPRILWAYILQSLFITVGVFLFFFPGIVISFLSMFTLIVVVTSEVKGINAIRYSVEIVKHKILQTLLLALVVFFVQCTLVVGSSVIIVLLEWFFPSIGTVASGILNVLITSIVAVVTSLQYVIFTVNVIEREKEIDSKIIAFFNKKPDKDKDHLGEQ